MDSSAFTSGADIFRRSMILLSPSKIATCLSLLYDGDNVLCGAVHPNHFFFLIQVTFFSPICS